MRMLQNTNGPKWDWKRLPKGGQTKIEIDAENASGANWKQQKNTAENDKALKK